MNNYQEEIAINDYLNAEEDYIALTHSFSNAYDELASRDNIAKALKNLQNTKANVFYYAPNFARALGL